MAGRERDRARRDKKRDTATLHLVDLPQGVAATPQERCYESCPCTEKCTIHGECRLCVAYHGRKGAPPPVRAAGVAPAIPQADSANSNSSSTGPWQVFLTVYRAAQMGSPLPGLRSAQ